MGFVHEKSADAFRTISEVAEVLDTPAHVLRFWESKFTQIKPVKRGGGRRYYRPQDIDLLRGIRDLLYAEGMTIKGVQKVLREQGVRHVTALGAGTHVPTDVPKAPPAPPKPVAAQPTPKVVPPSAPPAAHVQTPEPAPAPLHDPNQMSLFDPAPPAPPAAAPTPAPPAQDRRVALAELYTALSTLRDRMKAATT